MNIFELRNFFGKKQNSIDQISKSGVSMNYILKLIIKNLSKNNFLTNKYCF